jgi:hypothetical protein
MSNLSGYTVHAGLTSRSYSINQQIQVNAAGCTSSGQTDRCGAVPTCTYVVRGLARGTWHFAVSSYDSSGERSLQSNEMSVTLN